MFLTPRSRYTLLIGTIVLSSPLLIILSSTVPYAQAQQAQAGIYATYIVRIPPNAYVNGNLHYYPAHISIPVHTTIEFANDDPNQQHIVTSGMIGSPDAGKLFDSGVIPEAGAFQYTFDNPGDYPYFCKLHPWMQGTVSVSGTYALGHAFKMSMGSGAVWNMTKTDRNLFTFEPVAAKFRADQPITYTITILRNGTQVFSKDFITLGGRLPLELVPTTNSTTVISGPDTNEPVTGAYHVSGSFLNSPGVYTIRAQITREQIADEFALDVAVNPPIGDEFVIQIVPEFPSSVAAASLLAGIGILLILAAKRGSFGRC